MSLILHISDLHFGRVDANVQAAFLRLLKSLPVDVSVVSGDFTQRAKRREFQAAADFVQCLPKPHILVPGNHDIPLYNLFHRFVSRLRRYKRYISSDLRPLLETDDAIIAGINTAYSMTIKDGRVTHSQMRHLKEVFCVPSDKVKVLVTHHPLHLLQEEPDLRIASRSRFAKEILRECGVDVLLSGHYHRGLSGVTSIHKESAYDIILVQCGTTLSTRIRGQSNSFNLLNLQPSRIEVRHFEWSKEAGDFTELEMKVYQRENNKWQ